MPSRDPERRRATDAASKRRVRARARLAALSAQTPEGPSTARPAAARPSAPQEPAEPARASRASRARDASPEPKTRAAAPRSGKPRATPPPVPAAPPPGKGPVGEIVGILGQLPPGAWTEQKADMAAECIALARRVVQTMDPSRCTAQDAVRLFQLGVLMLEASRADAAIRTAEGGPQSYDLVEAALGDDEARKHMVGLMRIAAHRGQQRAG